MIRDDRLLIDRKTMELVRSYVPSEDSLHAMSEFFSALGDGTRLKIISALSISEMCVTDLSVSLGINQTTVSHQLRNLRAIGAVKLRRQGKVALYSLAGDAILEILLKAVNAI